MTETPTGHFELTYTVEPGDIDMLGHVNNMVYLRWVQEVATAHWAAAAAKEHQQDLYWVVVRHEIDYQQAAAPGDTVIARTWVGTVKGLRFERHTAIFRHSDGDLLAKARTLWCPMVRNTGRPTRVPDEVRRRFSVPGPPAENKPANRPRLKT